jgi:hypothetical protein
MFEGITWTSYLQITGTAVMAYYVGYYLYFYGWFGKHSTHKSGKSAGGQGKRSAPMVRTAPENVMMFASPTTPQPIVPITIVPITVAVEESALPSGMVVETALPPDVIPATDPAFETVTALADATTPALEPGFHTLLENIEIFQMTETLGLTETSDGNVGKQPATVEPIESVQPAQIAHIDSAEQIIKGTLSHEQWQQLIAGNPLSLAQPPAQVIAPEIKADAMMATAGTEQTAGEVMTEENNDEPDFAAFMETSWTAELATAILPSAGVANIPQSDQADSTQTPITDEFDFLADA